MKFCKKKADAGNKNEKSNFDRFHEWISIPTHWLKIHDL
jgi:hypothetical protein